MILESLVTKWCLKCLNLGGGKTATMLQLATATGKAVRWRLHMDHNLSLVKSLFDVPNWSRLQGQKKHAYV